MQNPTEKSDLLEETGQPSLEWYDDLPPASENPTRVESFSAWLSRVLVNELNQTLQDANKLLAVLNEIDKLTASRQTLSGETLPSPLAEKIAQVIKENKLDETMRDLPARLQNSTFKTTLEATLRDYWSNFKNRGNAIKEELKVNFSQPGFSSTKIKTEDYMPEEPVPAPVYQPSQEPLEVSPADVPAHDLMLDVFDEGKSGEVLVVVEHPSLMATSIRVLVNHDILTITATDFSQESYHKEALLPYPVDPAIFSQEYRNGVLEIRLRKLPQAEG
ncbi:MAG: hypothetical protein J0I20_34505 [Chloroflexi bacterium]|nr:hypothetical protein [Chloroflexota bacterium]OJV89872.1 MAG: hypothetical protein BGO39_00770 [Chloroflexi bacterium 54-19]